MKKRVLICMLLLSSFSVMAENKIKISVAYPSNGSVIAGQIGLVLDRTDTLKIYGLDGSVKATTLDEANAGIVEGKYDLILTTENNFIKIVDKNAKVKAISTLGTENNSQLLNVINIAFGTKNKNIEEKLNGVMRDAFYYLITHKKEVNNWYATIAKMPVATIESISKTNKNYNAESLPDINIKISNP